MLLCSCEKVIDVDLNNVGKKYVIDGTVINQAGCKVKISQTVNFSDASVYPAISGAVVTIKDNNGTPVTLPETSPGVYETNAITGTVAHTYTLSVSINGQLFTSTSQMPLQINFDSLYVEETSGFGDPVNLSNAVFQDPPGKGNSYNFIQYKNGKPNSTIFITNDDFTDGKLTTTTLRSFNNDDEDDVDELKTGDVVRVEMQCIDAAVYKYWYSLNQGGTGSSNNATPGNPVTNISNDALGYFSAHTVQSKSVVVQ
ncbi:MAG: DUF4249 domain-containing protein [Rhizobacter sp.]|nr:DUF4249 domain-containing protein [Ferruginibacter sp.]